MQTNQKGYPISNTNGKWEVGEYRDYTTAPDPKVRVFKSKKAAERVAREWNTVHNCFSVVSE